MKSFTLIAIGSIVLLNIKTVDAQTKSERVRHVEIASLVMDAQTLQPLAEVIVYGEKGQQLAVTNSSGYFRVTLTQLGEGEIKFNLKIEKEGYGSVVQHEHWGDLSTNSKAVYYIGLNHNKSRNNSFSEMETIISDLSFESVSENFKSASKDIMLEQKIETAKRKNDNVFFEIDNSYYLVNDYGWIKLNAKDDKILMAGGKVIAADQLNAVVKRKNIKGMTPIVSDVAAFEISMD